MLALLRQRTMHLKEKVELKKLLKSSLIQNMTGAAEVKKIVKKRIMLFAF